MQTTTHHTLRHIPTGLFIAKLETPGTSPVFQGKETVQLTSLEEARQTGTELCSGGTLQLPGNNPQNITVNPEDLEILPARVTIPKPEEEENPANRVEKELLLAIQEEEQVWYVDKLGNKTKDPSKAQRIPESQGKEHLPFIQAWSGLDILLLDPPTAEIPSVIQIQERHYENLATDPCGDIRIPLWEAIHEYVMACGGDPSKNVHGNTRRQKAVVAVEAIACRQPEETTRNTGVMELTEENASGKILTFQWSTTVQVPVSFQETDYHAVRTHLDTAWANTQKSNGTLVDVTLEP